MAIEGIQLTLEELTNSAGVIRRRNDELSTILNNIRTQMNNLKNSWSSEASMEIQTNFEKLNPKFENYFNIIDSYADFLDKTVISYQGTESTNVSNAAAFE